ncbi:MAG: phosphatase domain-containing protein [Nocardioidaceae bacterium]
MADALNNSLRPHHAARAEARLLMMLGRRLRAQGWTPRVVPYVGYGADGWVRVLARVLLTPPGRRRGGDEDGRGWRRFFCASAADVSVTIQLGEQTHVVTSVRDGYVDVRLESDLEPGWNTARLSTDDAGPVDVPVRIVAPGPQLGLVSDIDDTVMVTMLPRPLMALSNAFLLKESARQPVPGMGELYAEIVDAQPDIFVVYLSTGAWNTAGALGGFLGRHGYPPGPLLLTDWGPTQTGWFRSGQEHKREQLRQLFKDLPQVRWLLVGDDGQHDPSLYAEAAAAEPDRVLGVAIRKLSATEQVMSHGTQAPKDSAASTDATSPGGLVRATDGFGLRERLRERRLILSPGPSSESAAMVDHRLA